ncbi:MAG: iron ABC transporter substrate-binding protein [Thermoleophilia bacterium]
MHGRRSRRLNGGPILAVSLTLLLIIAAAQLLTGCGSGEAADSDRLTIYSGRSEDLIGPLVESFQEASGIEVSIRYADTAELAATILEEGDNSPADVFLAQDAGALGAVSAEGRFATLEEDLLSRVDPRFRAEDGSWVGLSGRARVLVYSTDSLTEADLPDSVFDLTDPKWRGKIGWAPTNGSFQAFVTSLRVTQGEDATRDWLEGILANEPRVYPKNSPIVEAVGAGEIEVGLVNHYYLYRFYEERGDGFPAANHYFTAEADPGNLINVAGAGILDTAANPEAATKFIRFMLSDEAQTHFAQETAEYPLVEGIEADPRLKPLAEISTPEVDLSDLRSLEETLDLLRELGIL